MLSWAGSPRTRDNSAKLTPQEGLRILWIPLHLVNSELLLKIWQFSLFSLLLLLPTHLAIKTCHVTNPVLQPVYCQAEPLCCELPSAHSHHSLLSRPVFPKPQAHFKCDICSSAATDTATRSSVHADTSKSSPRLPLLFLLLPLHLYQNPGITAVGKVLPDQSPACDRSTPCHQTTAHLDIISAIVLEAIPKTNLALLKPPSLQDHTPWEKENRSENTGHYWQGRSKASIQNKVNTVLSWFSRITRYSY